MVREIVKPTTEHYDLLIPKEYINKEIEIMILPLDLLKTTDTKVEKKEFNPKEFYAVASCEKSDIDKYLSQNKSEWE